ncbi:DUF4857 domain-containing protein [Vibrio tubiashii]|uniref:DUF4857 domain-containing protein n=1 Tax=Vibrio tubiashii TaxID=29498 RepID=A0AAE5GVC4_9VIBR|nr:DUF4857 domain-containing protein [Vibrio tubiashii]NOI83763.1 DUF4857 domain-containing protein [Vibrio tubiashii]
MSASPILSKEWLKLRQLAVVMSVLVVVSGGYFVIDLVGQFANIEPESMMWYRYSHLGDKPYWWVMYVFFLVASGVALCQFIPEVLGKRIRILMHLPMSVERVIGAHLVVGGSLVLAINALLVLIVLTAIHHYYPIDIVQASGRELLLGQLPAIALYLGLIAVLVENDWRRKALKLVVAASVVIYTAQASSHWSDVVGIVLLLWLLFPVKDSFLSVKTRRLTSVGYTLSFVLIVTGLLGAISFRVYSQYVTSPAKYYLFYSHILQDYVYQRNAPHHKFYYGTATKEFDKLEFESVLPFVFWKNFDIQGKLPIEVEGKSYNKNTIRRSRMSLQYSPERLTPSNLDLYPLFNPVSDKGSIRFPENAFAPHRDGFQIYAAETAQLNKQLSENLNQLAVEQGVQFPIQAVWGKTTNMKPFDWGYFVKDSTGKLFNLRRADNQLSLTSVASIPGEEIDYLQVSENRHKKFYGYAITKSNHIYLLGYPDYQWIKLDISNFDRKSMSFQLLADPISYLLRYDDGSKYYAVRFDKQYRRIDDTVFE